MSFGSIARYSLLLAGLSGLFGGTEIRRPPEELRRWILKMHEAQIELLKMDWGNPGFCTKWDVGCSSKKMVKIKVCSCVSKGD